MKRRLQRQQRVQRSVGPRSFIHLEHDFLLDRLFPVGRGETDRNRHGLIGKLPRPDRRQRLLMTVQRELVTLLARDPEALAHALGRQSHREISPGMVLDQPRVG